MGTEDLQAIEKQMEALPILQYAVIPTDRIRFEERVRDICRNECPQYGSTWSCPPAVGTVEECRQRCLEYRECFVFSSVAEVRDITNMEETLATRAEHEEMTHEVVELFKKRFGQVMALSTESCAICPRCSYPEHRPCRFPDRMYPCVESHGILVTDLAEMGEMDFNNGANVVTWFSVILFDRKTSAENTDQ